MSISHLFFGSLLEEEDPSLMWEMQELIPPQGSLGESFVYFKMCLGKLQVGLRHHSFVFAYNGKKD